MLVSRTLAEIASLIKPGITTLYLDKIAEMFIRDNGATPAFRDTEDFLIHSVHLLTTKLFMVFLQIIFLKKVILFLLIAE